MKNAWLGISNERQEPHFKCHLNESKVSQIRSHHRQSLFLDMILSTSAFLLMMVMVRVWGSFWNDFFCIGVTRVEMDWRCSWKRGNHISNVTLTSNLIGSQGLLSLLLHHCSFISKAFDDCWKVLNVKYHQNFAINVQDAIAPECESGWSQCGWKTEILSKPDQPTNQGQHDLFWTRQRSLFPPPWPMLV